MQLTAASKERCQGRCTDELGAASAQRAERRLRLFADSAAVSPTVQILSLSLSLSFALARARIRYAALRTADVFRRRCAVSHLITAQVNRYSLDPRGTGRAGRAGEGIQPKAGYLHIYSIFTRVFT